MTGLPPFLQEKEPPDRVGAVLGQSVSFNPHTWKPRLPDGLWPTDLDRLESTGRFHRITREDVFALSTCDGTPACAVRSYIAVCVWGTGTGGRGVARRARPLRSQADVGERLLEAIGTLRGDGAVAAYRRLRNDGDLHIKGLGPAFFSKVLYFTGWNHVAGPRPLILDRFVARALDDQAGLGWRPTWNWTSGQYDRYLDLVAGWAVSWGTEADVVERELFEHGKALSRRR